MEQRKARDHLSQAPGLLVTVNDACMENTCGVEPQKIIILGEYHSALFQSVCHLFLI